MPNHANDCTLYREEMELGDKRNFSEDFRQHLKHCPQCQQDLNLIGKMDNIVKMGIHNIEVPIGLKERITSRLVNVKIQGPAAGIRLRPYNLRPKT